MAPDWVQLASGEVQDPDVVDEEEASSRVTRRGNAILGVFSNRDATLLRSTNRPSPVDSFHGVFRSGSTRSFSVFCCTAGCASVRACVAVSSTTWATIARLAQLLGSLDEGESGDSCCPHLPRSRWTNSCGSQNRLLAVVVDRVPPFNGAQWWTVECTFIQQRFHPLTLSSKHDFIHKTLSSNSDTFIQELFHPIIIDPRTFSSNEFLIQ